MSDQSTLGGLDGGYFAAPVRGVPSGYGEPAWSVPAQVPSGPVPPAPPAARGEAPGWVWVVATVLALTGIAAGWVGMTAVVALNAVSGLGAAADGEGVLLRALLLMLNAAVNLALAYQLLRGWEPARWAVTAICAWWTAYWLWKTSEMGDLTGMAAATPFMGGLGQLGTMLTLGLLMLAGLAAGTAGLLWTSAVGRHLTGR